MALKTKLNGALPSDCLVTIAMMVCLVSFVSLSQASNFIDSSSMCSSLVIAMIILRKFSPTTIPLPQSVHCRVLDTLRRRLSTDIFSRRRHVVVVKCVLVAVITSLIVVLSDSTTFYFHFYSPSLPLPPPCPLPLPLFPSLHLFQPRLHCVSSRHHNFWYHSSGWCSNKLQFCWSVKWSCRCVYIRHHTCTMECLSPSTASACSYTKCQFDVWCFCCTHRR
jgi:hypothetical protein